MIDDPVQLRAWWRAQRMAAAITGSSPAIRLGAGVLLGRRCELHAMASIIVGDDCFLGPGVLVFDHNHVDVDPDRPIGHQLPLQVAPVEIDEGSWIGAGAIILAGARIGRHTRVGAGTVVVPGHYRPGSLLVGNPARARTDLAQ
jgi:acetyltransferase-like isoleucine patch superfamily enzyme